jgi:hypothetical protein
MSSQKISKLRRRAKTYDWDGILIFWENFARGQLGEARKLSGHCGVTVQKKGFSGSRQSLSFLVRRQRRKVFAH